MKKLMISAVLTLALTLAIAFAAMTAGGGMRVAGWHWGGKKPSAGAPLLAGWAWGDDSASAADTDV